MIVVVGAGLVGSCLTRALRDRGKRVLLVGNTAPDSLAALAVVRKGYHPKPQRPLVEESLRLLTEWGAIAGVGATVTHYRTVTSRIDNDWTLVDPRGPLLDPDVRAWVTAVTPTEAVLTDGTVMRGRIVVCPGAASPFTPATWTVTHGFTWTHPDPNALNATAAPLRVHHAAPYKSIVGGIVNGAVRLGSSSATTLDKAREQANKMLTTAADAGMINTLDGWRLEYGQRAKGETSTLNDVPIVGGYHRTGYATVPAEMITAARMLT